MYNFAQDPSPSGGFPGPAARQLQSSRNMNVDSFGEFGSLGELENKSNEEIHCN